MRVIAVLLALLCVARAGSELKVKPRQDSRYELSNSGLTVSSTKPLSFSLPSITAPVAISVRSTNEREEEIEAEKRMNSTTVITTAPSSRVTSASIATPTESVAATLPLPPTYTPTWIVAAILLMAAGGPLCVLGNKMRWVQTFLSTGLLGNLAITVLILYVTKLPINLATQGAYFVAATLSGVLVGAGASALKSWTEGLGCLLGGFCIAMWILTLEAGGTIKGQAGVCALIALCCLFCWALSLSHHSREYALIMATSFSGATVFVLGIDCFSQAGLKEFWLYIWSIRSAYFFRLASTYPVTRGIRAETIVIPVLCVVGVLCQSSYAVTKSRQRDAEKNSRDAEKQQEVEVDEIRNELQQVTILRERDRWEKRYQAINESKPSLAGNTDRTHKSKPAGVSIVELDSTEVSRSGTSMQLQSSYRTSQRRHRSTRRRSSLRHTVRLGQVAELDEHGIAETDTSGSGNSRTAGSITKVVEDKDSEGLRSTWHQENVSDQRCSYERLPPRDCSRSSAEPRESDRSANPPISESEDGPANPRVALSDQIAEDHDALRNREPLKVLTSDTISNEPDYGRDQATVKGGNQEEPGIASSAESASRGKKRMSLLKPCQHFGRLPATEAPRLIRMSTDPGFYHQDMAQRTSNIRALPSHWPRDWAQPAKPASRSLMQHPTAPTGTVSTPILAQRLVASPIDGYSQSPSSHASLTAHRAPRPLYVPPHYQTGHRTTSSPHPFSQYGQTGAARHESAESAHAPYTRISPANSSSMSARSSTSTRSLGGRTPPSSRSSISFHSIGSKPHSRAIDNYISSSRMGFNGFNAHPAERELGIEAQITLAEFQGHVRRDGPPMQSQTTVQAQNTLAELRASVRRESMAVRSQSGEMEIRRADMLQQKQSQRMSVQLQHRINQDRQAAYERLMRRADTQDLHRQALRKMQAQANQHI